MLTGNYLIAGAGGLMGNMTLHVLSDVPSVHIRAAYHTKKPRIAANNISVVNADLRSEEDCTRIVKDIDYVFMFAAKLSTAPVIRKSPVSHVTENMIMNARMLEAAYMAGVKKFLWLSSSTGYPLSDGLLKEENMFEGNPPDVYFPVGWMNRFTEVLCRMYATKLKNPMTCIVLRPSTLYGEYESFDFETCHMLPALVRKVVERHKPIEVWGTGQEARDLLYAEDMVNACMIALEKIEGFDVFNIGYGTQYTVNDILNLILDIDGYSDAEIVYNSTKPSTINKRTIDFRKAANKLSFSPKTSIREGISRVISWYRKNELDLESGIQATGRK